MFKRSGRKAGLLAMGLGVLGSVGMAQASILNIQLVNVTVTPAPTALNANYTGVLTLGLKTSPMTFLANVAIDGVSQDFDGMVTGLSGQAYLSAGHTSLSGGNQPGFISVTLDNAASPDLRFNIDADPGHVDTEFLPLTVGGTTTYTLAYSLEAPLTSDWFAGVDVSHWAHRTDVSISFGLDRIGTTTGTPTLDITIKDPVPEPTALALLAVAGVPLGLLRRKRAN